MPLVALLMGGGLGKQGNKVGGHLPVQLVLILLEDQNVIGPFRHELRRHRPLAPHRIERNDTTPNVHQVEHLRDGDQLILLYLQHLMHQAHALPGRPAAHQLDRSLTLAGGRGAAQLFAINNQVPTGQQRHDGVPPLAPD